MIFEKAPWAAMGIAAAIFMATFANLSTKQREAEWTIVYEQVPGSEVANGSKQRLIEAVRSGKEVRIYWATGRVEHLADAGFLTVFGGEVFAQVQPIRGQRPSLEVNPPSITLAAEGNEWVGFFSTTESPYAIRWFVKLSED